MKIIGIAGSIRKKSFNGYLLKAAKDVAPKNVDLQISSIADIQLYNGDYEELHGIPPVVAALKDEIAAADALLLVTPEYNQSLPGVLKNAIDWLSRPGKDIERVFGGKPVAVLGATPGRGGTRFSQTAWLPVFRALSMNPWLVKQIYIDSAASVFSEDGHLIDSKIGDMLTRFVGNFAEFVAVNKVGKS